MICHCKQNKGYTLIELIIVIVLVGISLGLVLVSVDSAINKRGLKKTVQELSSIMRYAKSKAQISGEDKSVFINLAENYFAFNEKIKYYSDEFDVTIDDPVEGKKDFIEWEAVFYMEGGSSGGNITISDGNYAYNIVLDPLMGCVVNKLEDW